MSEVIFDAEADNLLDDVTKVHCLQMGDLDGDDAVIYVETMPAWDTTGLDIRPMAEGLARLKAAKKIVGHHVIGYDLPLMQRFYPGVVDLDRVIDTLVCARLIDPNERLNALKEWGERLKVSKGDFTGPWDVFTREMADYAVQDIHVARALRRHQAPLLVGLERVQEVEHKFAWVIHLQERNGFLLDVAAAEDLAATFRQEQNDLNVQLQAIFPPLTIETPFTPKVNRPDLGYVKGVLMMKKHVEVFNAASGLQIGQRLMAAGWKPSKYTPTGIPQTDETVLRTVNHPAAKLLIDYLVLAKKLGQIADGKTGWLKLVRPTGRVHGRVNTIGCAPGRCSHMQPNMAQVNKADLRMRAVWLAGTGLSLVGVDAEGLQARILAHYLVKYDKGAFVQRLIAGSKKDRTDVHSANLTELVHAKCFAIALDADQHTWDVGRDGAKRCLYACWFGASDTKLGWTCKDGAKNAGLPVPAMRDGALGKLVRAALNKAIVGFKDLCEDIQKAAKKRGYLRSPLGRHVPIRSPHSALVFLMQAGEADVMKLAAVLFHFMVAQQRGWEHGVHYAFTASVHDEIQMESPPDIAEDVGKAFADCITQAGVELNLKCPLAGAYRVGSNWASTH